MADFQGFHFQPATQNCYSAGVEQVAKIPGLQMRGRIYYSRIVVPLDLVHKFGREQVWKSLQTKDRREAEVRHHEEVAKWKAAFLEAKREEDLTEVAQVHRRRSDEADVANLARRFFQRRKAHLDVSQRSAADPDDILEMGTEDLCWELSTLASWDNPDASRLVGEAEKEALADLGDDVQVEGRAATQLAELLRRALVQLGALELARLQGDYRDRIEDSFFRQGIASNARFVLDGAAGPTLGECIDRYQSEAIDLRHITERTRDKRKALLRQVGDHFGRETPLQAITRADCNRFRMSLQSWHPTSARRLRNALLSG